MTTSPIKEPIMVRLLLCLLLPIPCFAEEAKEAPSAPKDFPAKLSIELGDVTQGAVTAITKKLDEIEKVGTTQEIWLRLNSFGGDVEAGTQLITRLEQAQTKVVCVADFKAMSMAALILESPGCKTRLMTDRTTLMFHHASIGGVSGDRDALRMFLDWMTRLDDGMARMCAKRMGMTWEELEAHYAHTPWFLNVDEAKQYHAIDDTVDPLSIPLPVTIDMPERPFFLF